MKYCGIYCITNLINGKKYVGQSIDITRRWSEEKARSKDVELQKRSPIYAALNKYGISNFDFTILEECDEEQLDEREWYWVNYYNSYAPKWL